MKYNILIVDDEKIEREGVAFLIQKFDFPMVLHKAENGVKALELLEQETIDIILCDIKMPYMNGMDLSAKVKVLYPEIKVIFLTAFAEFSFAKQAIELGAFGYLLKPIVPEEFEDIMNKLLETCEQEEMKRNQAAQFEKVSLDVLKYEEERKMFELINGLHSPASGETPQQLIKRMILLSCNSAFFDRDKQDWAESLQQAVGEHCNELVLNESQCLLFLEDNGKFNFPEIASRIQELFELTFLQTVFIVGSDPIKENTQYRSEFEKLEQLLTYQFFAENSLIMAHHEPSEQDSEFVNTSMENIRKAFEAKEVNIVKYHLDILFSHLQARPKYSQFYIKVMLFELIKLAKSRLKEWKENDQQTANAIDSAKYMTDARKLLDDIVERWEKGLADKPNSSSQINHVKSLVQQHYMDSISLEWLAAKIYLTPSYLSFLFHKETGISLQKYITTFRMEQAERLVRETSMKIVDISRSVGYANQSYFCAIFRNHYGKTPQKYREDLSV